ncbi:MAG: hypothetical protein IPM06_18130 [Rhizobiales bacterium]|nr:hypothetical protein [Hyphomicrobiales bacterium]
MSFIAITAKHCHLRKVRHRLRCKGFTAYLPAIVHKRIVNKGGKPCHKRRVVPLMSYILVQVPSHGFDTWLHDVLETDDVRGYLKSGDKPATVSLGTLLSFKIDVAKMVFEMEAQRHKMKLKRGAKYAIKSGSLAGKAGTVKWIRGKKAGLEAKLFGSVRVIEVAADNLEAA